MIILFVLISLSFLSIFIGFIGKDLFVGIGTDIWHRSINIFSKNNFFETELSFIFGGMLAFNKIFPLLITNFAVLIAAIVLLF